MTDDEFAKQLKLFKANPKFIDFELIGDLWDWLVKVDKQLGSNEHRYDTKDFPSPLDEYMRMAYRIEPYNTGNVPYDFLYVIDAELKCVHAMIEKYGKDKSIAEIKGESE